MFERFAGLSHVHFVGIGGAGMSGIAEVLRDYDLTVTGCDLTTSEVTDHLQELGIRVLEGHDPAHLAEVDLVVISSAVPQDNPEVVAAREQGLTVARRAEMLAELMRLKYGIAVAGTHGKTTTTSLIGTVLTEAGLDPTVIVGGRLRVSGTGARLGKSDFLVAEADEFDRSFLRLAPIIAVVTSIDRDHLDTYRDLEDIQEAFVRFADRVPFFGQAIVCLDDPNIQGILPRLEERRVVTYGLSAQADLAAVDLEPCRKGTCFTVRRAKEGNLGRIDLSLPGVHNVQNALAAVAVGLALDLEFEAVRKALGNFTGIHRRFEELGSWRGATVIDDYAHHPTEVEATLRAVRQAFPKVAVHAIFQPHLYSRTRELATELGRSLLEADFALVTEVYPSRERPLPGVTGELVVEAAKASGHRRVLFCPQPEDAIPHLEAAVAKGDVVITLGAGDIYRLAERLAGGRAPEDGR